MPHTAALPPTFKQVMAATDRSLIGMWLCSGSPMVTEIAAGSGLDWLMIDGEHAPLSLETVQRQLQIAAAYRVTPVVRVPTNDKVLIKQYLDLGAQNLIVPMVNSAADAEAAVSALRYPPQGVRGVGAALSRGARWNRVDNYLHRANDELVSLLVQIETAEAVANAAEIAAVDGVDGMFIGPNDLAASMGLIGQPSHPDVKQQMQQVIDVARAHNMPVGITEFNLNAAQEYVDAGLNFVLAGADVALLARSTEALATRFIAGGDTRPERASY
ncbi:aldolase/citrate lyase family protein [Gulosibacter bifidus]|uniref:Aldolase/citrate lyase family protein n=1 Tax=Gulosibacter bifidus TaxID=272239 RepID=A0ABW5RJQ7_9MICO|nr:HpcH/HpaI aldolase/citrate lyase family protein [Gulosibacter bifidus]